MKRVFILLFLIVFASFCLLSPIHAAQAESTSWVDTGYAASMEAAATSGDVNAAAHVSNVNTNTYSDFIRRVLGPVPGITTSDASLNSPYNQKLLKASALNSISSYITSMYITPPASTYAFVQDIGQTLGFIPKQAYAQGIGFSGLTALLPVWKVFRDIAYVVLALIMVTIGFMVMFRKKIDPKTVVTVQNALPKIVITLLLVTFSDAIGGIAIDVMYLLIALVGSVFQSTNMLPQGPTGSITDGTLWHQVFANIPESQLFYRIILGIHDPAEIAGANFLALGGIGLAIASISMPVVAIAFLVLSLAPALIGVLFSIGLLLLFIRLFVFFLSTYIKIIIALVFAPFQLLLEAVPGSKAFDSWFRGLIANILIFPAASVLFLLSAVFMQLSNTDGTLWHPPYAGLFVNNATSIGALISLGILFMIPNVGKMINEALKPKPGLQGGIGELGGMLAAPTQIGMQLFQMAVSKKQMEKMSENITKAVGGK
ncbi:MAG: hypothetical protein V1917_03150 [Candidatus Gottesmanbacteria bacterium]